MKAVVWHGIGKISLDRVPDPHIKNPTDAIVRITQSAICGTDLHFIRGTMAGMKPGTVLGHEGVGIVESVGTQVRNFRPGDRVVVPSTIGCGSCSYCRAGYYAQCDAANPNGPQAGTAFYGGPALSGPFDGMQAEAVRVPYAHVNLVKLPDSVRDDQAIAISDIYPTAYFGADLANIHPGHTVAVFGCGPVGLFAVLSAFQMGAGRVIAVDGLPDRLEAARRLGAEPVNFETEHPVATILALTGGIGVDRAIDAVGVDAVHAHGGPARPSGGERRRLKDEAKANAPKRRPDGENWIPGDGPTQALDWEVQSLAKAGTLAIIGVYPPTLHSFPIGAAMNRNITVRMGNCNHRKYMPTLVAMTAAGTVDPGRVLTQREPLSDAIAAFEAFDAREAGWIKVALNPAA